MIIKHIIGIAIIVFLLTHILLEVMSVIEKDFAKLPYLVKLRYSFVALVIGSVMIFGTTALLIWLFSY